MKRNEYIMPPAHGFGRCAIVISMELTISHDRQQETPEAKARWFQSLSLTERMAFFCSITDLIIENNPQVLKRKHAQPTPGRVCVLTNS